MRDRRAEWKKANDKIKALRQDMPFEYRAFIIRNNMNKDGHGWSMDNAMDFIAGFAFCVYCGVRLTPDIMSLDHIVPGIRSVDNMQIICRDCNFHKGILTDGEYRDLLACLAFSSAAKAAFIKRTKAKGFHEERQTDAT